MFKYRSLNKGTFDMLLNQSIYFNNPSNFNDPLEFYISDKTIHKSVDGQMYTAMEATGVRINKLEYQEVYDYTYNMVRSFIDGTRNELLNSRGACCFSRTNLSHLLWSHYSDGHRGVCVEYRDDIAVSDGFDKRIDIEYPEAPFPFPFDSKGHPDGAMLNQLLLKTKHIDWNYEKEIRIYTDRKKSVFLKKNAISSIYFGIRMDAESRGAIAQAVRAHNPDARYYEMSLDSDGWDLVVNPNEIKPNFK